MTAEEFYARFAPSLTAQQREAVEASDGAVLLLAVPGSGKTTTLILRLGYMLLVRGIEPEKTLTMTYTVAATVEMRERFRALFGSEYADRLEFRTINGVSAKIISYYASSLGRSQPFELCSSESELIALVRRIYNSISGEFTDDGTVKNLRAAITYAKNMMLTEDEIKELDSDIEGFSELYRRYNDELRALRQMDYDDQMVYALAILQRHGSVLSYFRERYTYVSVDEAQDTSKIQHEIIALLSGEKGNVFMVGDEDQSIYGFRAAYPRALMDFGKTYEGARILKMEDNFRSTDEIIAAANLFISKNKNRYEKLIRPTRRAHREVTIARCLTREAQYRLVMELCRREKGECAVLYRNNESALPLIDMMEREHVAYNCRRFDPSFFSSRVVEDVSDIIRFAFDPTDSEIFLRIYYKIGSMLTKEQAKEATELAKRFGSDILSAALKGLKLSKYVRDAISELVRNLSELKVCSAGMAVILIRLQLGYAQYAESRGLELGKLDILSLIADCQKDALGLLRRLDELRELVGSHENSESCPVTLSTVHSCKGLEFKKVYIIDVKDGIFPFVTEEKSAETYEEERRLFYVAMTRAKDELCLMSFSERSPFIREVREGLPTEVTEPDSALLGAVSDRVGKKYRHSVLGEGVVTAQSGDRHLIEFSGGKTAFLTLSEMLENREKTFRSPAGQSSAAPKTSRQEDFVPGVKVAHSAFGDGVIISVSEGVAAVKFFRDSTIRRLGLKLCAENGILTIKETAQ